MDSPRVPLRTFGEVAGAVTAALATVDANRAAFGDRYPGDTTAGGRYLPRAPAAGQPEGANVGWTTGFWPGALWLAYQLTGGEAYRGAALGHVRSFADRLRNEIDVDHHDLGFLYTLSCVAPFRLTGDGRGRDTALAAAGRLLTRVVRPAGIIQAWGAMDDPAQRGRAIVDSLMNTPLLFWASRTTGDDRYAAAARGHVAQLRDHILRPDGSTFHTFYWDPVSGEPLRGGTHQGSADDSCWARGQAWAIYGFSLCHRHVGDDSFLRTALRCADYFLARLPADHVAYWDLAFGDGSGEERDSSAAAIAVCGLLDLAGQLPAGPAREGYLDAAGRILRSLIERYSTAAALPAAVPPAAGHPGASALLLHGVYHKPNGVGVDEGSLWGDYFYLEALTRVTRPGWVSHW